MGDPERDHSRAIEDHGGVVVGGEGTRQKGKTQEGEEGRQMEKESKDKKHDNFLTYYRRKRGLGPPWSLSHMSHLRERDSYSNMGPCRKSILTSMNPRSFFQFCPTRGWKFAPANSRSLPVFMDSSCTLKN